MIWTSLLPLAIVLTRLLRSSSVLDDQIKGVRAKVLVGKGHVTHEEAMAKAEDEFNAYRARELRQLESDFSSR